MPHEDVVKDDARELQDKNRNFEEQMQGAKDGILRLWERNRHQQERIARLEHRPKLVGISTGLLWENKKEMASEVSFPTERIERAILLIRGHKALLDEDLAALYEVETKNLVKAVKRNSERFPPHFMFQLSFQEFTHLRLQFGTPRQWGGRRTPPYAFTEQGVAMLSSVLRSQRAIQVNIAIMDTFVRLRQLLSSHVELARKLAALEKKYDAQFKVVFDAIRQLMAPLPAKRRRIGFHA